MKYVAKNSEGIPSDYCEQYYKEVKNTKPKDLPTIRCSRNGKNRGFTKITIY